MEPPPSLSTPAAALPSVPPINLKRATKSEETSAPPPTVSPRLFQKTPRSDSKDKERASKEKLVSPRRGFKKSSSKAALHDNAGPLQRDTKQAELIKSKSGNTIGKKKSKSVIVQMGPLQRDTKQQELIKSGKKSIAPPSSISKKFSLSTEGDRNGQKHAMTTLVGELAPLFPHCSKEQIAEQLEASEMDVDKAKVLLEELQRTILMSPQMTRSFAVSQNAQSRLFEDRKIHAHEDSLGSLDTIMLREMEARKSTDGGVLGLSPGSNDSFTLRHGRSIRTSMDARNVVEDALSQLDGVLKETRMMQVNERSNWRDSVEPVVAVESDEEEDVSAEGNSLPLFQSRPPSIVVQDETGSERSGTDQHEKVEVLPIPIAGRVSTSRPHSLKHQDSLDVLMDGIVTLFPEGQKGSIKKPQNQRPPPELKHQDTLDGLLDGINVSFASSIREELLRAPIVKREEETVETERPPSIQVNKQDITKIADEIVLSPPPAKIRRSPPPSVISPSADRSDDAPKDKIVILKELLDRGIISQREFDERLARLNPPKPEAALKVVAIDRERRMSEAPPPVPEFPGIEAFGLPEEDLMSSFDQIMARPVLRLQEREAVAAIAKSPEIPKISIEKGTVLKGVPSTIRCERCKASFNANEFKLKVRFCPSCGEKL